MKSVYKIPQKIKCLMDERKRKSIPLFNIVMPVLLFLMLQYESFHTIFSAPESMSKRLKNCISGRIPKVDAVRDLLSRINPDEIRSIHEEMIDIIKRNRVFWEGTIGGKRLIERLKKRHGHFRKWYKPKEHKPDFLRWAANRKSETDFMWKRRIENQQKKYIGKKQGEFCAYWPGTKGNRRWNADNWIIYKNA